MEMKIVDVYIDEEVPSVVVELERGDWIEFPDMRKGLFNIRTGNNKICDGGVWIPTPAEVVEVARKAYDFAKRKRLRYAVEVLEQYI